MRFLILALSFLAPFSSFSSDKPPYGRIQYEVSGSVGENKILSSDKEDHVICASSASDDRFQIWGLPKKNQFRSAILFGFKGKDVPSGNYKMARSLADRVIFLLSTNSNQYIWAPFENPNGEITLANDTKNLKGTFSCQDLVEVAGGLKTDAMRVAVKGTIDCEILYWNR